MIIDRVSGKKIVAAAGIVLLLGLSAGCSQTQKLSWERLKATHYRLITGKHLNEGKPATAPVGQTVPAPGTRPEKAGVGEDGGKSANQGKVDIVLYFADQNGDYLKAEKRQIEMVPGLAKATVEELIRGPKDKGLTKTMPEGTRVRDINIQKGLCRINLSKQFKDNHWGGSSGEILTVYSLVDTLTQFDTIKKVEILVDGQKIDTLAGHMDLTTPVFRNTQIVKSEKK